MKTIVLINNNLKHDNRVKRHVQTMLNLGQRVTVIACPDPDYTPGLEAPGMDIVFWRCPSFTLQSKVIRKLAEQTKTTSFVFRAFPGALGGMDALHDTAPLSRRIQIKQMKCSRWNNFRDPICKEDINLVDDYRSVLCYFEFMLQWAAFTCQYDADCIYCNDLPSLLAGVAHKLKFNSRLIYDAHEIFYDMVPGAHSRLWKEALALLELHLTPFADRVIGVSQSHADWMKTTYGLRIPVLCVPNCFGMGQEVEPPAPKEPGSPLRIYYHGASDQWRGLDKVVVALAQVPETELVLRCYPSESLDKVKQQVAALEISDRVSFLPLVPSDQMIHTIRREADVGIHACEPPTAVNIKVGLANKFVEYLMAGIPIITSPLDEQAQIVREFRLGYVLSDNSPAQIKRGLGWMCENRSQLRDMGARAYQAAVSRFNWKSIRKTLEKALTGENDA